MLACNFWAGPALANISEHMVEHVAEMLAISVQIVIFYFVQRMWILVNSASSICYK